VSSYCFTDSIAFQHVALAREHQRHAAVGPWVATAVLTKMM
jgi:hypothetical protein